MELIDHAARVLERSPTHSLPADLLYERVRAEAGADVGIGGFVEALRAQEERFAVLLPPLVPAEQAGWQTMERSAYERALAELGMQAPTVILAERRTGEDARPAGAPATACAVAGTESRNDLLGSAHSAVTALLGAARDAELRCALHGALVELEAARRVLESGS